MKKSERTRFLIREMWAARRSGLVYPGVPIGCVPRHVREWVRNIRKTVCLPYWANRATRLERGPLLPH